MKINAPSAPRGIPAHWEIEEVALVLCGLANLNHEHLTINLIGGQRTDQWNEWGIKLLNLDPSQPRVRILFGCRSSRTVEGLLFYNPPGTGMALTRESLHAQILQALGNKRTFVVTKKILRQAKRGEDIPLFGDNPATPTIEPEAHLPVSVPDPFPDSELTAQRSGELPTTKQEEPLVERAKFDAVNPSGRLTHDGCTLHLAVTALVAKFEVGAPFSFSELVQVLTQDASSFDNAQAVKARIRVFIGYGFLKRLNLGTVPARYAITDIAVSFANSPDPTQQFNTLHEAYVSRRDEDESAGEDQEKEKPSSPPPDLFQSLQSLKEQELSYQALSRESERRCQELFSMQDRNTSAGEETVKIQGEINSLEKKLVALRNRLLEIEEEKVEIQRLEREHRDCQEHLRDPQLVKAHLEYLKLKELLTL